MKPVVQEEITGCGIASSAAIAGITYKEAKAIANSIGIYAEDQSLWSDTQHIRKLLAKLGIKVNKEEKSFKGWASLPDCALISLKWHLENGKPYWHWSVFIREGGSEYYLIQKRP